MPNSKENDQDISVASNRRRPHSLGGGVVCPKMGKGGKPTIIHFTMIPPLSLSPLRPSRNFGVEVVAVIMANCPLSSLAHPPPPHRLSHRRRRRNSFRKAYYHSHLISTLLRGGRFVLGRSLSGRWIHPHFLHAEVDLSSCDACPSYSFSFLALLTHSAAIPSLPPPSRHRRGG